MNACPPLCRETLHDLAPRARLLDTLVPNPLEPLPNPVAALRESLEHPVGMDGPAMGRFRSHDRVAIAVPDASRKAGLHLLFPELLRLLEKQGVAERDIWFFFALGVHRPATAEEQCRILGSGVYERFRERCCNHDARDPKNLAYAGRTARGTEVYLNRKACECDRLILTGSVVPHYFAGFGGGRKALVPGLAGAETIAHNHALNLHPTEPRLDPRVRIAALDGNPVAEDLLEAARLHPPDFIVNTVLTATGDIGGLFSGELDAAHRAACTLAAQVFCVPIRERADLVIASIDDAPNFIQSHKALVNACAALKPDGRVILRAPAPEGLGGAGYRRYLEMGEPEKVIAALREQADINGQTALSTLEKGPRTLLISELSESDTGLLRMEKADTLESALTRAREHFRQAGIAHPTCYLMPQAGITVPLPGV